MNKLKYITPICFVLFLCIVSSSTVFAYSFGPPHERTGAPNENTCATAGCHTGNSLNAAGGSLVLTVPKTYEPGEVYDIVVKLSRNGQRRWGFQMTALNGNNVSAGSFSTIDANTQLNRSDNKYIQHTATGTAQGTPNMHSWMFKWTAPANDVGTITFYTAGNAANSADGARGDYIYTQSATSEVPYHGVSLQGVGNLTRQTADASSGIRYTVQVRNTGNISDTIGLTTSGDVSATLSRNTVSLAAGATANVTVSIPGSALTAAGEYDVNVNATSQGDSTKTAEISTTTTILPVYSISLAGVGALTTETSDASAGVSYQVRVTNNGNTRDTIRLTTSGDVNATVSSGTITLNRGASQTVTLRISGTALTKAGEYEVKVKASSQGDDTIAPEITTTTTILPVYGFSIAGVGDLKRETADGSAGVVYRLSITNDGNTTDVIDLSTSGDADATLSSASVSLASGASEEVSLTVSADGLMLAGVYEVKVSGISQGDNTQTAEITTTTTISAVYGFSIAGVGDLELETADGSAGVVYRLSITNDGNTTDVIALSTSGDADATLSTESVSLASGASEEVTVTVSGDGLTLAGMYEVKVSGISQNDNTKTAEISTTTTILPVYGFSIAGVGALESETADGSAGVVYTLSITNDGNTTDVIDLSTSGDSDAELSAESVSLASGASEEVSLTVSADGLALADAYEVKVSGISQGDNTKTVEISTTTTILPVYGFSIAGVGALESETSDGSAGVVYRLSITNDGNTTDVIDLSTSGDADATLSSASVSLTSGASEEVTLTISADGLTLAGAYEVKVTGISQGDNTKTVEISTTTTILPVYGISVEGVGDLESETSDGSDGVVYTLSITNDGNTTDVIDLSVSGDADAELSAESVSLASGASEGVTLTISGDGLTLADVYEVKVTATSQSDATKTSEISTITTILPVYGFSIAGVGDLESETSDAGDGVAYKLSITNNGNTTDVIDLSASGGADATLSADSVSLTSGASEEVTLTISADGLMLAGAYEVKVSGISQGDNTKTVEISTTTTILPVYGISVEGVGDLASETSDAGDGVAYTLSITNDGNTADVIDLSTSGDADATLSAESVSLASGASEEVTLTISGDGLMLAGAYEVKVSGISQGDNTKTVEISTTTTILPVYGFSIEGVGDLESATADGSDGVVYMFTITNDGNTADVIDLSTSGDADATLSSASVSLASGASEEVTLTISGDGLMLAGAYSVKVTAISQGDNTISDEVLTATTILPVYDVVLEIVGTRTGTTTDAVEGVTYLLKVTNIGNIEDTILLGSSAEVGIGGAVLGSFSKMDDEGPPTSQLEITLAPGVTEDVMFIASGDLLTEPGGYEIEVTATSKGNSTKSAAITTSTTIAAIPPVYGVTLDGEGDLPESTMGSTMDILTGVTYTLVVTNTGNTEDTILLGSSAEVGIEGSVLGSFSLSDTQEVPTSQLEIIIPTEASETVLFTVSGDDFTESGEYEITVTATSQGDNTKTAALTTTTTLTPVYSVKLEGKDALTGDTTDAVKGVSYVLIVTNEGNTEDTVVVGSSAAFGIEGSVLGSFTTSSDQETPMGQIEVMLPPGTSTEVTFTATGDFFTKPGEYEITVTATSQGDNTKTAALTTTTTLTPVYSVKLEGKDALTGDTTDAVKGVSYVLIVTNEGNTEDTVVVGSSAAFGIEGSVLGSFTTSSDQETPLGQIEVMLSPGASTEVTFTAAGDFFTKPGEYEIVVTATSKADEAQTTELTITTTISPVPWDVNADGTVNILDLVQVTNQFGESGSGITGDVNMDGQVNILDLVQVASYIGKTHGEIVQEMQ